MSAFKYTAVDRSGAYLKGTLEAGNAQLAAEQLRSEGMWVVKLSDPGGSIWQKEIPLPGPKVTKEQFTLFCRQLATMYEVGINLVDAIEIISRQTSNKYLKRVLHDIAAEMKGGSSLSHAAAGHPEIFSNVFIYMIEAGEVGGNLDIMLQRIATMFEKEHTAREKVKSAMVYPAVMCVVIVLVVMFLMIFVVPQYIENFKNIGLELPLPTRIVIGISNFTVKYWYIILLASSALIILIARLRKTRQGKYLWDYYSLKVPVFGVLWHKQAMARFSRTLCSLHSAAVPLMQCLNLTSKVVGNEAIARVLLEGRDHVSGGRSMSEPLKGNPLFPPMITEMMSVGEETGTLDVMLEKVADFYEADVDMMADRLRSLIEPLIIVLMTGVVGIIVLAIMLPSFSMMDNISKMS
ncbi:type II secretion system F family protein [Paenibacillus sp. SI8]|uniref:type II secretion system F family protein n=1 Tax=unclassified Paenibacillus TaxID=185978 RepID=UPI003466FED1